jgi:hypothetical protein
MSRTKTNPPRREDQEQIALFQWVRLMTGRIPELDLLYHTHQGAYRGKDRGSSVKRMKLAAMGVKPGVPDLFLPVSRGGYHGLWIEMKVGRNRPTVHQKGWIGALCEQGYRVRVCWSMESARDTILEYLGRG